MKTLLLILLLVPMMSFGQNVYIPDANFKAYLVDNAAINTNGDSEIQVSEASAFTGVIICPSQNISDLTGIEAFTALTLLNCGFNQLTSLDVSNNTALTELYCYDNQLTSLDVSSNTALTQLGCEYNQLQCLNANNGQNFNFFYCDNNQLSCVSVSDATFAYNNYGYDPWVTFQFQCVQNPIDNDINQIGNQLTAEQSGATFQWLDCDDNYAVINGETNQSYTATTTGNYAVQITQQDCFGVMIDTSTCVNVDCQSVIDNDVNQIGTLLTAVQNGVSYQWLDCDNNYSAINGETNQTYTPTTTGYFAVELTSTDACGGVQVDTSTCNLVDFTGIGELNNTPKQLIKIVDVLGRETPFKPNTPLLYIYNDGTVERKMIIK